MSFYNNSTMLRKSLIPSVLFLLTVLSLSARAERPYELAAFKSGSYRQILANNAKHPFMLVVWSINCPSCLKDMELLSRIHKNRPELKIIMLAADDLSAADQIHQIVNKNRLSDIDHWVFADENTQKLRFEIDPKWYGEIELIIELLRKTSLRKSQSLVFSERLVNHKAVIQRPPLIDSHWPLCKALHNGHYV